MDLEIRKADSIMDATALLDLDQKTFPKADAFSDPSIWLGLQCFLLWYGKQPIASFALALNRDHRWKIDKRIYTPKSIFIVTTGILPAYQGMKLGRVLKEFQIAYTRLNGFHKIEATARVSNERIITLNKRFGFKEKEIISEFYENPAEDMVVLELKLK
ncbi:MAG: GNAT family N-acetyltransferase [Candidatus Liptonbacteria bacterium]|nr:GNAT family N-acetyltransferase [Candidatus Liptonbacteria bacterium]